MSQIQDNRFYGAPYPIKKHPLGLLHTQSGISQIRSDLLILLLTNPGERVMLPEFGTPLRSLVFEQNDAAVAALARQMIIDAINLWEPRIVVESIDVTNSYIDETTDRYNSEHVLHIKIKFFDPENIKEVQDLNLEVPLAGTGT